MKASQLRIAFFASYLYWISIPTILLAQDFDVPRSSPKASVSQHIGVTKIDVGYCRPSAKSRKIFGELIPFGKVWRTGANEATTISFPHEIKMEDKSIQAGKYALFTIPGKDSWTVILNSEWNQWGTYHYDYNKDIVRIEVKSTETEFTEMFAISFTSVTKESGAMKLQWENTSVELSIETDTYTHTLEEIDKVTKELGTNWYVYSAAAQYHFYELKNTSESIKLIDVAIALDAPNPAPWMLKSQILAYEKKYEAAIEQAELALEVCKDHNFSYEIHENKEQIKKWKELLNK